MAFYDRFIQLCDESGIKPTPLMKQLNLSVSSITRWKGGSNVTADMLIPIAKYFNVSTDYLLDVTDYKLPFGYSENDINYQVLLEQELNLEKHLDELEVLIMQKYIEKLEEMSLQEKVKVAASMIK